MIIHPTSRELADIAHRLGMDARTAKAHRKIVLDVWKAAIYSAVNVAYDQAITREIVLLLGKRVAAKAGA